MKYNMRTLTLERETPETPEILYTEVILPHPLAIMAVLMFFVFFVFFIIISIT